MSRRDQGYAYDANIIITVVNNSNIIHTIIIFFRCRQFEVTIGLEHRAVCSVVLRHSFWKIKGLVKCIKTYCSIINRTFKLTFGFIDFIRKTRWNLEIKGLPCRGGHMKRAGVSQMCIILYLHIEYSYNTVLVELGKFFVLNCY